MAKLPHFIMCMFTWAPTTSPEYWNRPMAEFFLSSVHSNLSDHRSNPHFLMKFLLLPHIRRLTPGDLPSLSLFLILQKGTYRLLVRIREDAWKGPGTIPAICQAQLIAVTIVILIPFCYIMCYNSLEVQLPSVKVWKDWA